MDIMFLVGAVLFLILAPILGGLLTGCDRVLTARFQSRVGPPFLQPFYDVAKLWHKEKAFSNPVEIIFTTAYLVLIAFSGAMLATGGNLLFVVFSLTLAHTFLILAAYAANAPFSHIGAERELLSLMILEPVLILIAAGCYMVTGSFETYHMLKIEYAGYRFPAWCVHRIHRRFDSHTQKVSVRYLDLASRTSGTGERCDLLPFRQKSCKSRDRSLV